MASKIRIDRLTSEASPGIGIGPENTESSAILNVSSTTQGVLIPRMTADERNAITSPATGLIIYNTIASSLQVYNGSAWTSVGSGGGGGGGRVRQLMLGSPASTLGTSFSVAGNKFLWVQSRNSSYSSPVLIYRAIYSNRSLEVRVVNATTGAVLATSAVISASGTYLLPFTAPSADAVLEVQIRATSGGGVSPTVDSAAVELDMT